MEFFAKALHNGLDSLNIASLLRTNSKEEEFSKDSLRNESMSIANFSYMTDKSKGLPFIYGTKQFFSTETIGKCQVNLTKLLRFPRTRRKNGERSAK